MARCPPGRCSCNASQLLPRVCELGDAVERHRVELQELTGGGAFGSPELAALASEGGTLDQRCRENAAQVARLRAEVAGLAQVVDRDRGRARQLHSDRRRFLQRLGDAEASERSLRSVAAETNQQLHQEKRSAEEKSSGQEQVLAQLGQAAASAEQRCRHAETCAARLRGQAAEAEAGAAAALRFAGAEAERGKRLERELQSRLEDEQKKQRQEQERNEQKSAEVQKELDAELQQCELLRKAEHSLATRLEESHRRSAVTEHKALNVARELVDSSQAIAWLQTEVAAQRDRKAELDELTCHNSWLRQQLHKADSADPGHGAGDVSEVPESRKALQLAWEGEAREHRAAQRRLQLLEVSCLGPVPPSQFPLRSVGIMFRNRSSIFVQFAHVS
ncbi:unnamed protein product [Effrenium voratum]|uniref:Uncharacterized protein n=1 Tax=Effrenium voratum TaxID=2562239 RepID=A0AA36HZ96_9DINO|nr:unnamed protein product [Effrenium voratum]